MKKTNFFIIGAPKCGTTSLAAWLAEHPSIYMSAVKEPHFFNVDGTRFTKTLSDYDALFANVQEGHIAIGEASTHYLYSLQAVPRILEYNPDAKFIVCIRNPIEMAPSLHSERVWGGAETVKDFEKAWRLQDARRHGKYIPLTMRRDPDRLQYGAYCRLGEQIDRLYSHVSQDRVLVLTLDDLAKNPQREYQKVLRFLDISENVFTPEFVVYNERKAVRSVFVSFVLRYLFQIRNFIGFKKPLNLYKRIQTINTVKPEKTRLSPELKSELRAYFEVDIHLLERQMGRDFSNWLLPS